MRSSVNKGNPETIDEIVTAYYTKEPLAEFCRAFLRKFILDNQGLCRQNQVPLDLARKPNLNKSELVQLITPFFRSGELFRKLKNELPPPLPQIVAKIVWDGVQDQEDLELEFQVKAVYTNKELNTAYPTYLQEINPLFALFKDDYTERESYYWGGSPEKKDQTRYQHAFYFPLPLQIQLRNFLEKPPGYTLNTLATLPEGVTVFTDLEHNVFTELPVVLSYIQQGNLAVSDSGNILVGSLNKLRKYCGLKEFYPESPDKYLTNLRTRFITGMVLALVKKKITTYTDPVAFIKQGFTLFAQARWSSFSTLFHLKGFTRVTEQAFVNRNLFGLLHDLPLGQWVAADNFLNYCYYQNVPLNLVSEYEAHNHLYLEGTSNYDRVNNFARQTLYRLFITEPLVRGTLYLFASLGLIDIAYQAPANPRATQFKRPYISVYDGLAAIRLTPLGAYIGGLTKEYIAPATQTENIVLDRQHLFITYTGENKPLLAVLHKVARPAGDSLFKVDAETILTDCQNSKELEAKINIFKQLVSAETPPNWELFFNTLRQKSYKLKAPTEDLLVFQLPDNKELIRLIASDDFLKRLIIKAEMFYIILPKQNLAKVKNQLKKFGFLLDFH